MSPEPISDALAKAIEEDEQRFNGACFEAAHKAVMEGLEVEEIAAGKFIWGDITSVDLDILKQRVCSS